MIAPAPDASGRLHLADGASVEDQGDAFYLVFEHAGCDLTLALDEQVAWRLADYLAARRALRKGGSSDGN